MTLSKRGFLARLAYFPDGPWGMPDHISLCPLFWRIAFRVAAAIGLGTLGVLLAITIWKNLGAVLLVTMFIAFVVSVMVGIAFTSKVVLERAQAAEEGYRELTFVETAFWAIKNRVCPRIQLTDPSN